MNHLHQFPSVDCKHMQHKRKMKYLSPSLDLITKHQNKNATKIITQNSMSKLAQQENYSWMMILKRNIYLEAYSTTIFHMDRYLWFNEVIASCFSDHLGSVTANFNSSTTGGKKMYKSKKKSDKKMLPKSWLSYEGKCIYESWSLDFKRGRAIELGSNQLLRIIFISYRQNVKT